MFTGIIKYTGRFDHQRNSSFSFFIPQELIKKISPGLSIAINGICLTVEAVDKDKATIVVEVMEETLEKTNLIFLEPKEPVNLELPSTPKTLLSGHLVTGHVDGVAYLQEIIKKDRSRLLKFSLPPYLTRYVVIKGSIAINGISLTVIEVGKNYFTVGIIPYSWEKTMLHTLRVGDPVNLETDILAKYAHAQNSTIQPPVLEAKIAIISSKFRKTVVDHLEKNCLTSLYGKGIRADQVDIFRVPGSWEIPLMAKKVANKGEYSAIIVFGAIVKGETYHFEQISNECARGCMEVALQYNIPVVFEILSVYKLKDAEVRATGKKENKGVEAALTALEMIHLMSR